MSAGTSGSPIRITTRQGRDGRWWWIGHRRLRDGMWVECGRSGFTTWETEREAWADGDTVMALTEAAIARFKRDYTEDAK